MERCERGRIGLPAKELYPSRVPGVRIPPSPYCMFGGRVASGTFVDRLGDSKRALADQREEQAPGWRRQRARRVLRASRKRARKTESPSLRTSCSAAEWCQVPLLIVRGIRTEPSPTNGRNRRQDGCKNGLVCLERCPSGLRSTLGKRACPQGTGGSNPPLSVAAFRAPVARPYASGRRLTPPGPEGSNGKRMDVVP